MNKYNCLKKNQYTLDEYMLVPLREEDIFLIMKWRNEQIEILRQQEPLTKDVQLKYYKDVIQPTFTQDQPKQILFSYLLSNKCIGYGGLVHIDWYNKRAEVSYLVDTERTKNDNLYEKEFVIFLNFIKEIAFDDLNLNKLHSEAYDIEKRKLHIKILEENGFIREGILRKHVIIKDTFVSSILHGYLKEEYLLNKYKINFRDVTIDDADILFNWRNDYVTRMNSINTDLIQYDEHINWLKNTLSNLNKQLMIVEIDNKPVASIRIDKCEDYQELSWIVAPEHRNKGIGKLVVSELLKKAKGRVLAKIKKHNTSSKKIAEYAGFSYGYEKDGILYYFYESAT